MEKGINYKILEENIKSEIDKKGFYISKFENYFEDIESLNIFGLIYGIGFSIFLIFLNKIIGFQAILYIISFLFLGVPTILTEINKNKKNGSKNIFFNYIFLGLIFSIFIIILAFLIFLFFKEKDELTFFISIFISIPIIFLITKPNFLERYIFITKNNVYIGGYNYEIFNGEIFSNSEVKKNFENGFFPNNNFNLRKEVNFIKSNILNLENFSKEITKIKNNFSKNIENLEFHKLKNEIIFLSKYINKSIKIKEKIKNEIISKKYFPEEKFENYLKENLVFPLKEIKKILENNLEKIEDLKIENSENQQIILANKRLEIQKNSLKEQILLLDEKIKKLEV